MCVCVCVCVLYSVLHQIAAVTLTLLFPSWLSALQHLLLKCEVRCFSQFSDDSSARWFLPAVSISGNAWLRTIQRKLYRRDVFGGVQAAASAQRSVLWVALSGLIKEDVIYNIGWPIFLVISILPDILWEEEVSVRGSDTIVCVQNTGHLLVTKHIVMSALQLHTVIYKHFIVNTFTAIVDLSRSNFSIARAPLFQLKSAT